MVFVATDNVDENVRRVTRRAFDGGHSAPEARLREIYQLSLANLPDAIRTFDDAYLYDSSAFDQPPRLVARFLSSKVVLRSSPLPRWCLSGALRELFGE